MKIEIVKACGEEIFLALDDALFWGDIQKSDLEAYKAIREECTEVDSFACVAIERALNISLPSSSQWYNVSKGKNI